MPTTTVDPADAAFEISIAAIRTVASKLTADSDTGRDTERDREGLEDDLLSTAQAFLLRDTVSPINSRENALTLLLNEHNSMVELTMLHVDLAASLEDPEVGRRLKKLAGRRLRQSLYAADQARARLTDRSRTTGEVA
jgi:hypothetical protein